MKSIICFFVIIITGLLNAQTLKLLNGNELYYHNKEIFKLVTKFDSTSYIQGYDIVDSNHIFFAYNPQTEGGASSILIKYNLEAETESIITEIGATGESYFSYNSDNDMILFNWFDGIYIFKLHDSSRRLLSDYSDFTKIINSYNCFFPYWISYEKIGYYFYDIKTDNNVAKEFIINYQ